jgi:hypothetical protein
MDVKKTSINTAQTRALKDAGQPVVTGGDVKQAQQAKRSSRFSRRASCRRCARSRPATSRA